MQPEHEVVTEQEVPEIGTPIETPAPQPVPVYVVQVAQPVTPPTTTLPALTEIRSRRGLAGWLEIEAALITATAKGSDARREVSTKLVAIASRPNDNEHSSSGRRIAELLRDPDLPIAQVILMADNTHHFRAPFMEALRALAASLAPAAIPAR